MKLSNQNSSEVFTSIRQFSLALSMRKTEPTIYEVDYDYTWKKNVVDAGGGGASRQRARKAALGIQAQGNYTKFYVPNGSKVRIVRQDNGHNYTVGSIYYTHGWSDGSHCFRGKPSQDGPIDSSLNWLNSYQVEILEFPDIPDEEQLKRDSIIPTKHDKIFCDYWIHPKIYVGKSYIQHFQNWQIQRLVDFMEGRHEKYLVILNGFGFSEYSDFGNSYHVLSLPIFYHEPVDGNWTTIPRRYELEKRWNFSLILGGNICYQAGRWTFFGTNIFESWEDERQRKTIFDEYFPGSHSAEKEVNDMDILSVDAKSKSNIKNILDSYTAEEKSRLERNVDEQKDAISGLVRELSKRNDELVATRQVIASLRDKSKNFISSIQNSVTLIMKMEEIKSAKITAYGNSKLKSSPLRINRRSIIELKFTTKPMFIEFAGCSMPIGTFRIIVCYDSQMQMSLKIIGSHPHAVNDAICMGGFSSLYNKAISDGSIAGLVSVAISMLKTYDPSSPLKSLTTIMKDKAILIGAESDWFIRPNTDGEVELLEFED